MINRRVTTDAMDIPDKIFDRVRDAAKTFYDNSCIRFEQLDELLKTPQEAILVLLHLLSIRELTAQATEMRLDLLQKTARASDESSVKARRELAEAVEYIGEAKRLWDNINAVMEPLTKVAGHAEHCVVGELCPAHQDLAALAASIADHILDKDG